MLVKQKSTEDNQLGPYNSGKSNITYRFISSYYVTAKVNYVIFTHGETDI